MYTDIYLYVSIYVYLYTWIFCIYIYLFIYVYVYKYIEKEIEIDILYIYIYKREKIYIIGALQKKCILTRTICSLAPGFKCVYMILNVRTCATPRFVTLPHNKSCRCNVRSYVTGRVPRESRPPCLRRYRSRLRSFMMCARCTKLMFRI